MQSLMLEGRPKFQHKDHIVWGQDHVVWDQNQGHRVQDQELGLSLKIKTPRPSIQEQNKDHKVLAGFA